MCPIKISPFEKIFVCKEDGHFSSAYIIKKIAKVKAVFVK
jgi:hypothetical protein